MFSSLENVLNLTYYVRFIKNSLLKLPLKKGQFSIYFRYADFTKDYLRPSGSLLITKFSSS